MDTPENTPASRGDALKVLKEMEEFLRDFADPAQSFAGKIYMDPNKSFELFQGFAKMTVLLSKASGMPPGEFLECMLTLYTMCPGNAATLIKPETV